MAESSSNSSTTSTSTTGAGSSTSTGNSGPASGSQSSSNSGPAASGSQSSSNGSSSNGNGNGGSNSGVGSGLSFGAGVTSNSNGNFSGGLPGFALGTGLASDNFGQGWGSGQHTVHQGADGKHTITPGADGKHTVHAEHYTVGNDYSSNNTNYMTVDEVYGNLNQSIVENQGDYEASSNEESNVETSTFGKQDEISVTPTSVAEDKGLVNNDAIQSVEGLNFQQKDKANQDVMEAKKSRDEAEAEDNANGMRDQLKSVAEKDAEEADAFKVGDRDEDVANAKAEVDRLANEKTKYENEFEKNAKQLEIFNKKAAEKQQAIEQEDADYQAKKANAEQLDAIGKNIQAIGKLLDTIPMGVDGSTMVKSAQISFDNLTSKLGVDAVDLPTNDIQGALETFQTWEKGFIQEYFDGLKDFSSDSINAYKAGIDETHLNHLNQFTDELDSLAGGAKLIESRQEKLQGLIADNEKKSAAANETYNSLISETFVGEEAAEKSKAEEEAVTTEAPSYKANIEAARNEINNSKDLTPEQKAETNAVLTNVETAADAMNEAANALAKNPNDISAVKQYVEETAKYNKALEAAKGNNALKNTDFNKTFTKAVAAANDFMVTREDGTQQNYAEFAAEMATKSPELAKGLYEAKAAKLAEDGHKVLAAIENAKSKMVMTWLGSKFTFADNQVRSQFNQMAKTDMRATYATYNNVLSDPNATPEQKAEASAAINQANSLMVASAALQASTGFFSGIGDGTSDGVYGKTDPGKLNGYQEALNTASNFAKIALGLGVTPGANEAYQNMYYLAGDKAKNSMLFGKDFDGDGFALCQEYGNNAAVGMIAGAGELATGVALMFNPATSKLGLNLAIDSVQTFLDGLYGVQKEVNKSIKYSSEILSYFKEAQSIAAETGNKEAIGTMDSAIKQIEDFQLKSDEVGNLDNWLEGSGSNTADNGKFNQALSYDEWLKLIEADPTMRDYAKKLIAEKKSE